jgi:hypothetical protein
VLNVQKGKGACGGEGGGEYVRGVFFGSFPPIQDSNNKVQCGVDCLTNSVRQQLTV